MLNLCVFIFILYAVSYSARVILFGNKRARCKKMSSNELHRNCSHIYIKQNAWEIRPSVLFYAEPINC